MPEDKNIKHFDGKTMTASEYYYGCKADHWDDMTYPEALQDRYERVKEIYYRIVSKGTFDFEEEVRHFKIRNAYQDCKQLLDERSLVI